MTTTTMIQQAGLVSLLVVLLLTLAVTVLRLVSLPLAGMALALDTAATAVAGCLQPTTPVASAQGGGHR